MSRRTLSLPIMLAIGMIVLLVLLTVGWIIMSIRSMLANTTESNVYFDWTFLILGTLFLILIVVGVVIYLTLSIKAINLTQRQSNFIDSVTHELKSPITSLKLALQTLSRRPLTAEEQAGFFKYMLEDVERLDRLINHILSAARLDRPVDRNSSELIDLSQLLKTCAREVAQQHRVRPETISLDLQTCGLLGNEADLILIFSNLIDNAVKYANSEAPEVAVISRFNAERGRAEVRIIDNGPGIPGPFRNKVFRRFVRLGTELQREKPGTGLGLFIVRTLIDRWKGHIHVSSRDGEQGTVFKVTLQNATGELPLTPTASSDGSDTSDGSDSSKSDLPDSAAPTLSDSSRWHDTHSANPGGI